MCGQQTCPGCLSWIHRLAGGNQIVRGSYAPILPHWKDRKHGKEVETWKRKDPFSRKEGFSPNSVILTYICKI